MLKTILKILKYICSLCLKITTYSISFWKFNYVYNL